jgi:L-2,4-diaminobutyric acid acetyltransferase
MRGHGLALSKLTEILSRPSCNNVQFIETSINSGNSASWALFQSLARRFGAVMRSTHWFDKARHFGGNQDDEFLARIGPLHPDSFADTNSENTGFLQ